MGNRRDDLPIRPGDFDGYVEWESEKEDLKRAHEMATVQLTLVPR